MNFQQGTLEVRMAMFLWCVVASSNYILSYKHIYNVLCYNIKEYLPDTDFTKFALCITCWYKSVELLIECKMLC